MSIFEYNGSALVAMVGKNCFAIASDRRLGVQLQTIATDFQRIYKIHGKLYIGLSGLATDSQTLRISVEFQTLFSGDDRSKPLKEIVDLSHVRPLPPPDDFDLAFESGDEVDAFCNAGWKPGKISGVLENSSFLVILSNTHEAKPFGRSELRVHRDWIGGRWISAREQRKLEMDFGSGTPVEVRSDEEGFVGAWFAAKIVRAIDKNMFTVEYQNLRTDDESQLLRETVYSQNIRPAPPDILESKSFRLLEEVDAWYNDGWWVGVISKVVENSSYFVYFRDTEEEIEFKHSDLRLHQDWIGAKWVRASQGLKLCD